MLCNGRTVGPDTQARRLAALLLPPARPVPPEPAPSAAELLTRPGLYVGDGPFAVLHVDAAQGRLRLAHGTALGFLGSGRYRLGSGELRFGNGGTAERRLADGTTIPLTRVMPATARPESLVIVVGHYASDETEGRFSLAATSDAALAMTFDNRPGVTQHLRLLFPDGWLGDGFLMRVVRDSGGKITGVQLQTSRVYALDFTRVGA